MAEVYGVKPKIFTKEWWPYFWEYYKWHTIAVLFVALLTGMTIYQSKTATRYDLKITYMGDKYLPDEVDEEFTSGLETVISDIDGNGECNIFFSQLTISEDAESAAITMTMRMKHDLELTNEQSGVYLYSKAELENQIARGYIDVTYFDTDVWLNEPVSDDAYIRSDNGKSYAVCLKDSAYLKSLNIDGSDLYLLIRNDIGAEYENETVRENSIAVANLIVKK